MATYDAASATAYSLIAAKGSDVVFSRESSASFDPVTQQETITATTLTLKGVGLPPGRSAEFRIGKLERRNIIELHCAPRGGAVPQPGDKAQWAGSSWTVIWISDLNPAADGSPYCLVYAER